jgi:hypothetical protein
MSDYEEGLYRRRELNYHPEDEEDPYYEYDRDPAAERDAALGKAVREAIGTMDFESLLLITHNLEAAAKENCYTFTSNHILNSIAAELRRQEAENDRKA